MSGIGFESLYPFEKIKLVWFATPLAEYSLKIESKANQDPIRQSFLGVNGQYYSFIDYKKEFFNVLTTQLLDNFTLENLNLLTYDSIFHYEDTKGWKSESKIEFLDRNFELIKNRLTQINNKVSVHGSNKYVIISAALS